MYSEQPKKMLVLNILDILQRYTDEDHRLSQTQIAEILKREYSMRADRKSIRRNLLNLMDCGYDIEYTETVRMVSVTNPKTGQTTQEESYLWSDFYLKRDFTSGELRLLIDSLLFSRHIPYSQCIDLIEKLEGLSNIYFRSRVQHIARMPQDVDVNKQLFYTIELLDEAISKHRKVAFKYTEYGTDKKIHVRKRSDGSEREYVISPYQMAAREGKYYLICNHDKYDDISNYRLDRILDLRILDESARPFSQLKWANGKTLDLATYMREHPYMYSSDNIHACLRISKSMISDVIDLFGSEVDFGDETDTHVTMTIYANEMAVEHFAKTFASQVTILQPPALAQRVVASLEQSLANYRALCSPVV